MKPGQVIKKFKSKSNKDVTLRLLLPSDTDNFRKMYNSIIAEDDYVMQTKPETRLETETWIKEELKKIKVAEKIQLLAIYNNQIVGQCGVGKDKGRKEHLGGYGISIIKDFREDGIGDILSKEAIKLAKTELKVKILKLALFRDNTRALSLYRKLGFKEYGILPKAILRRNKYIDQLFMYKEL